MTIRISVRSLVEFVLRGGDIDKRRTASAEREAMQEGSRIHRKIQRQMGPDYHAEVTMKHVVEEGAYQIAVEGRADGVIESAQGVVIDEIKGMYQDPALLTEPIPVHLAQALCYGYFYCFDHSLDRIGIQVTYCDLRTEAIRRFLEDWTFDDLEGWFETLIGEYIKWADYQYQHELARNQSLRGLDFPYPYREGQKELASSVYRAIRRGKNLFIQAPTGVGKTLSVVYPSLKAIGEGCGEKLFYLTAKTITRRVAEECFELLRERGLFFLTVTITAKEKICPMEKPECNPDACPMARGHFDRVNQAVYEILQNERGVTREIIRRYAEAHRVCPFELCLDVCSFADGVICDYNYVFDPNAWLRRFFPENGSRNDLFLIDEAHNLVNRAREMYSAVLVKEKLLAAKRAGKGRSVSLTKAFDACNRCLLELKRDCETYQVLEEAMLPSAQLLRLFAELEVFLDEYKEFEDRDVVLDFYFDLRHFLAMSVDMDDRYRIYSELGADGTFRLHLFNIDPSERLSGCVRQGRCAVFFSATLLPVLYYKKLLTGREDDYAVYAHSPFDASNRMLLIGADVSSRYTRRNRAEYAKIAAYIHILANSHKGNYLAFFPSYPYLEAVAEQIEESRDDSYRWKKQESRMTETEREEFLAEFEKEPDRSLVGLCVLGGIFSEGIDLTGSRLEGALIVGTGLPMVCTEQEILRSYFDERGENGYDFAYQYPGMNKVMQAAGRVIRTAQDRGVILLLDDRFLRPEVQGMFPREWSEYGRVTRRTVDGWLAHFWET